MGLFPLLAIQNTERHNAFAQRLWRESANTDILIEWFSSSCHMANGWMETRVHSSMASPGPHVLGTWYCTWLTGSFRLPQKAASTCKCKSSTVKAQSLFVEECKTTECKHGRPCESGRCALEPYHAGFLPIWPNSELGNLSSSLPRGVTST